MELAVVVIILSIAVAVAAPAYSSALQTHRVEQATLRLLSDLRLARRRAELSSASIHVDVSLASHAITIRGLNDFGTPGQLHTITLTDDPYRTQIVQVDPASLETIEFNGFGTVETPCSLQLQSGRAHRTIKIEADSIEAF